MKQLTQDVFIGQPDSVKSAAVDSDGRAHFYEIPRCNLGYDVGRWYAGFGVESPFCGEYDATDWQNSAIDRE